MVGFVLLGVDTEIAECVAQNGFASCCTCVNLVREFSKERDESVRDLEITMICPGHGCVSGFEVPLMFTEEADKVGIYVMGKRRSTFSK